MTDIIGNTKYRIEKESMGKGNETDKGRKEKLKIKEYWNELRNEWMKEKLSEMKDMKKEMDNTVRPMAKKQHEPKAVRKRPKSRDGKEQEKE